MKNREHRNDTKTTGIVMQPLADEYLASLTLRGFSPRSVTLYRLALRDFLYHLTDTGRDRAQDITREDLEDYRLALVRRNFAPGSLEVYLRTVRQFFAWLEQNQRLFSNPAAGLVIPQPPRKLLPAPTVEQVRQLLAQPNVTTASGLRDRALLETAYATGARREELCRLTVFDVDLDNRRLRVLGKGKKERVLPLGRHAALWLAKYITGPRPKLLKEKLDEPALWIDLHGRQLSYGAFQQILLHHSRAAGIQPAIPPHALRRACATHMLRNGAHPLQLQMLLGHATLKTLSQYLRLSILELQQTHQKSNPGQ
jgi:integrase/recombinase XerD